MKRLLLTAAFLLTVSPLALAQQPAPPPDYTITLNGQEWFFVGEALAEKPFKQANPLLQKINQQITAIAMQRQKEEAEAAKAKADADKPKTASPPEAATKPEDRRDVDGKLLDKKPE